MRDKTNLIMEARRREERRLIRQHYQNLPEPSAEEMFGPFRPEAREERRKLEEDIRAGRATSRDGFTRDPAPE